MQWNYKVIALHYNDTTRSEIIGLLLYAELVHTHILPL